MLELAEYILSISDVEFQKPIPACSLESMFAWS